MTVPGRTGFCWTVCEPLRTERRVERFVRGFVFTDFMSTHRLTNKKLKKNKLKASFPSCSSTVFNHSIILFFFWGGGKKIEFNPGFFLAF